MATSEWFKATTTSTGREVPVRFVGEQHVMEDLGRIPTVADWLGNIKPEAGVARNVLGRTPRDGAC